MTWKIENNDVLEWAKNYKVEEKYNEYLQTQEELF